MPYKYENGILLVETILRKKKIKKNKAIMPIEVMMPIKALFSNHEIASIGSRDSSLLTRVIK